VPFVSGPLFYRYTHVQYHHTEGDSREFGVLFLADATCILKQKVKMNKPIFAIVSTVLLVVGLSSTAVAEPVCPFVALSGTFEGLVDEKGFGTYNTVVTFDCAAGISVKYMDPLDCSGNWTFNSLAGSTYNFTETMPPGEPCLTPINIDATLETNGSLSVDYKLGTILGASAVLKRPHRVVPTLSQLGIFLLSSLMLLVGVNAVRTRKGAR
jgi:hypothetical protein